MPQQSAALQEHPLLHGNFQENNSSLALMLSLYTYICTIIIHIIMTFDPPERKEEGDYNIMCTVESISDRRGLYVPDR